MLSLVGYYIYYDWWWLPKKLGAIFMRCGFCSMEFTSPKSQSSHTHTCSFDATPELSESFKEKKAKDKKKDKKMKGKKRQNSERSPVVTSG